MTNTKILHNLLACGIDADIGNAKDSETDVELI